MLVNQMPLRLICNKRINLGSIHKQHRDLQEGRGVKCKMILIACGWLIGLVQLGTVQAISVSSNVSFDTPTNIYSYSYTIQNDSIPEDEIKPYSFIIPFFGSQESSLFTGSIITPGFWSFEILDTSSSTWPYVAANDTAYGNYVPAEADYTSPDFILRFFYDFDPFNI